MPYGGRSHWLKWVIREDGTLEEYQVPATANGWGTPKAKKYELFTEKYTDSGKRYFGLPVPFMDEHPNLNPIQALIQPNGTLRYLHRTGSMTFGGEKIPGKAWDAQMIRGDRFPFSK